LSLQTPVKSGCGVQEPGSVQRLFFNQLERLNRWLWSQSPANNKKWRESWLTVRKKGIKERKPAIKNLAKSGLIIQYPIKNKKVGSKRNVVELEADYVLFRLKREVRSWKTKRKLKGRSFSQSTCS